VETRGSAAPVGSPPAAAGVDMSVDGMGVPVSGILASQPTGYHPVGKPSTGCGPPRQSHNANAAITGREAHKNNGSNANATII